MKIKPIILPYIICFLSILLSCASLTAPTGGPDDTTGPHVVSVFPQPEALNIPVNSKIIFSFSEWISPRSEQSISIFPSVRFKSKIHGNKLEILLQESLKDSITYHVSLNTTLKDLHGNSISPPYNLIFATGPTLDSGSLQGCIIDQDRQNRQPKVALFSKQDKADSGFTGPPTYLFQTDSNGLFSFNHLKRDTFYLIAYVDVNNDSRLQSGTEFLYIPQDSLIVISNQTPPVHLYPALFDTAFPQLSNVKALCDKIASGSWSRDFDSLCFSSPKFSFERVDSIPFNSTWTILPFPGSNKISFLFDMPLQIAQYRLISSITRIWDKQILTDTILFNGTNIADTVQPQFQSVLPSIRVYPSQQIRLIWSEPVYFKDTCIFTDTLGDTVKTISSGSYSDTTTLIPLKQFREGDSYRAIILCSAGTDLYGNPLKAKDTISDTAAIVTIQTISADSIASSLQGEAECLKSIKNVIWLFWPAGQTDYLTTPGTSGGFKFTSIPASKGRLGFFIDANSNKRPDMGRITPWISPEPYFISPDTIEARARWDIEGLQIPVCDLCTRTVSDTLDTNSEAEATK